MAIIELAQGKTQLGIAQDDDTYDDELQVYLDASTIAVEKARGQHIDSLALTSRVIGRGASFLLPEAPVLALSSVTSADGVIVWDVADMVVDKPSGLVTVTSGPPVSGTALASYTVGMNPVPANFTLAGLIILEHMWETRRGAMRVQMAGTDDYMPGPGFAIPRRALELIGLAMPGVA